MRHIAHDLPITYGLLFFSNLALCVCVWQLYFLQYLSFSPSLTLTLSWCLHIFYKYLVYFYSIWRTIIIMGKTILPEIVLQRIRLQSKKNTIFCCCCWFYCSKEKEDVPITAETAAMHMVQLWVWHCCEPEKALNRHKTIKECFFFVFFFLLNFISAWVCCVFSSIRHWNGYNAILHRMAVDSKVSDLTSV